MALHRTSGTYEKLDWMETEAKLLMEKSLRWSLIQTTNNMANSGMTCK